MMISDDSNLNVLFCLPRVELTSRRVLIAHLRAYSFYHDGDTTHTLIYRILIMFRPGKRRRQEVHCGGCSCGDTECVSCWPGVPQLAEPFRQPFVPDNRPHTIPPFGRPQPPPPPAANPGPAYDYMLSQLDNTTVRLILTSLATVSPSTQAAITSAYEQQMRMIQARVINFDHYSKDAWHVLNTSEYCDLRGSKQFEAAYEAFTEVESCINAIGEETHPESPYGTKLSALETLRKIAKTVILADDTLGHEVRNEFQHNDCLAVAMLRIVRSMTVEEQRRAGATADEKGSLAAKVRWVCDQAKSYCLEGLDGLDDVLALLIGEPVGSEEESYEDEVDHEAEARRHGQDRGISRLV
ncbi:hypothetical protein HD806DRAFT_509476 [Xylariaceae sp. AK1471]|nr:hypothetical protein HD806DRAFT_509476 [Xylariaceae sp. AK1471]